VVDAANPLFGRVVLTPWQPTCGNTLLAIVEELAHSFHPTPSSSPRASRGRRRTGEAGPGAPT